MNSTLLYASGYAVSALLLLVSCSGQSQKANQAEVRERVSTDARVGGPCEACDLIYFGMPPEINNTDTTAGWSETGRKLVVTGTVFQQDAKTPASNIVVYYYHTDHSGYYAKGNTPETQTRHGRLRGWIKTGDDGKYAIYTLRPAPYPNEEFPAHIHLEIKEPDIKNEYWIDDIVFEDDARLKPFTEKHPSENRGGSGVVRVTIHDDVQLATHDIVLGLNIPGYPIR